MARASVTVVWLVRDAGSVTNTQDDVDSRRMSIPFFGHRRLGQAACRRDR
jgi:hypothetical protein